MAVKEQGRTQGAAPLGVRAKGRKAVWYFAVFLGLFSASAPAATGTAHYVYDDLGRLIQVIAADGSSVQYAYDAVGNLFGIQNNATNTVSIAGFTPNQGDVGTVVTLQGSGFDTTPSANTVTFNGQAATVSAASATSLTVSVPSGATTGTVSVTNANGTASSLASFTVGTTSPPPTISSLSATVVNPGNSVTVSGTGFQMSPTSNNKVLVAGTPATFSSVTSTSLAFTTPTSTGGYVSVITPYGQGTSASPLLIVPTGITPANVVQNLALTIDGTPTSISLAAGKVGVYTFDGTVGQQLGLAVSGYSSSPSGGSITSMKVYTPQGVLLVSCGSFSSTAGCGGLNTFTEPLLSTGTYQVVVQADGTHASSATLTLSTQPTGTLTVDGTASTLTASRLGQAPRYTFSATAGQTLNLAWSSKTFSGTIDINVFRPDGTRIVNQAGITASTGSILLSNLTYSGTYTVLVWPYTNGGATGAVTLQAKTAAIGTLTVDGTPTSISLSAGQQGLYTFDGTVGQQLGLAVSGYSSSPSGGSITSMKVYTPQGVLLVSCGSFSSTAGCGGLNTFTEPLLSTGTYQVVVQADGTHASSATLTLSTQPTGTLTVDGTASTLTASRLGQAPRYTFSATAGQTLNLAWSSKTFSGTIDINVFRPDGTRIVNQAGITASTGSILLSNLTYSGTYTVLVWPYTNGGATGAVTLQAKTAAIGTLTVDGTPTSISLSAGQQGLYTFDGTVGQQLGLAVSGYSSSPSGGRVTVSVITPQGTTLANCGAFSSTAGCRDFNLFASDRLPSTGTYQVVVQADGTHASSATLTLSTQPSGTLTVDSSPATVTASRVGQVPRYTFSGTAGQNLSMAWSSKTFSNNISVNVYAPDGTAVGSVANTSASSGSISLNNLAYTGTYIVEVWPYTNGGNTGAVNLQVTHPSDTTPPGYTPTDALALDGTATNINLSAGQQGIYTFSGTVGEAVGLTLSNYSSSPSGGNVAITVKTPGDTVLVSCSSFNSTKGCTGLITYPEVLPSTGTYKVVVQADASHASTATLTLSSAPTGTLTAGGGATTVTVSRLGQAPRYTFSGTAGQVVTLGWANSSFSSVALSLYRPDGVFVNKATVTSSALGSWTVPALTHTGTYTVEVMPTNSGGTTGSIDLSLTNSLSGTLSLNGTPTSISLSAGQQAAYSFSGTSGQAIGLAVTDYSSSPSGGSISSLAIYAPNGSVWVSCGSYSGTPTGCTSNSYPNVLPSTGTYQVVVQADATHASTATLTLSTQPAGALTADATATAVTVSRVGQAPRYTFSATAGQIMSLAWDSSTLPVVPNVDYAYLYVYQPDGSQLGSAVRVDVGAAAGTLVLSNLTQTGTYTAVIWPAYKASTTGTLNLWLKSPATGTLAVDGSVASVSLSASQLGHYTFDGSVGQTLKLQVAHVLGTPSAATASFTVTSPEGLTVGSCSSNNTSTLWQNCYLSPLPSTGTYSVDFSTGILAATLDLAVSPVNFAGQ